MASLGTLRAGSPNGTLLVGESRHVSGFQHAVWWQLPSAQPLDLATTAMAGRTSVARAVNDAGTVVGSAELEVVTQPSTYRNRAFRMPLMENGSPVQLSTSRQLSPPPLEGTSQPDTESKTDAYGINSAGHVVGGV